MPDSSRLAQIVAWLSRGGDDGALVIFDESHRAKNLIPETGSGTTQTARCVLHLQENLPRAKVLYSSATGASEPRNLAYMTRLWGTQETYTMAKMLTDGKLGAMELAAMSLKATGSYLARTLSYEGADFNLAKVQVPPKLRLMYDRAVMIWALLYKVMATVGAKRWRGLYWGAHQRFYRSMLMATKVPECAQIALEAVSEGKSVVIGLQSTGEAATEQLLSQQNPEDLVSAPTQILDTFIRNNFPLANPEADVWERTGALETLEYHIMAARKVWGRLSRVHEVLKQHRRKSRAPPPSAQGESSTPRAFHGLIRDDLDPEDLAFMTGVNIRHLNDPSFRLDDDQWEELEKAREEASDRLRNPLPGRREVTGRLAAARAVQEAKDHKARLQACLTMAETREAGRGGASGSTPAPATGVQRSGSGSVSRFKAEPGSSVPARPSIVAPTPAQRISNATAAGPHSSNFKSRTAANGVVMIDLTGDSSDEEDTGMAQAAPAAVPAVVPAAPAPPPTGPGAATITPPSAPRTDNKNSNSGCILCDNPPDVAMATCDGCHGRAHLACLGLWDLESTFTCDTCMLKSFDVPAGNDQPDVQIKSEGGSGAYIKAEPGTAARVKPEPGMHATPAMRAADADMDMMDPDDDGADLTDEELEAKSAAQLRILLERAVRTLAAANQKLDEMDAPDGLPPLHRRANGPNNNNNRNNNNQRRSKAGKQKAAEAAAAGASDSAGAAASGGVSVTGADSLDGMSAPMEVDNPQDPFASYLANMGNNSLPTPSHANRDFSQRLVNMRGWLLEIVQSDLELPANPLDDLIERLGGQSKVAELTGRKGFVERDESGGVVYSKRSAGEGPAREINLREKDKFMNGTKRIAIISDAASTGISLQADRRVASRDLRRCHLTLELPWSADKAIQQFGRSHRANQVSAPQYRILVTPCGGEFRFASAAAKRLQSLGALLRGDRNAVGAGSELKAFDVDTPAGSGALNDVMRCFIGEASPLPGVKVPDLPEEFGYPANSGPAGSTDPNDPRNVLSAPFFLHFRRKLDELGLIDADAEGGYKLVEKGRLKISKFLNRLLGLRMVEQDLLFNFFADMLDATVSKLKSEGKYDKGIVSLTGRSISAVDVENVHTDPSSGARVDRVTLAVDGGLSFEEAQAQLEEAKQRVSVLISDGRAHLSGFYRLKIRNKLSGQLRTRIVLATEVLNATSASSLPENVKLRVQIPYGQEKSEFIDMDRFNNDWGARMVENMDEVKELWDAWFNYTATNCQHGDGCK